MPDICVWNICNNKCLMCTNPASFSKSDPRGNYDLASQVKKMKKYLKGEKSVFYGNGADSSYAVLTGGEPTIHPDFFPFLWYLRKTFKGKPVTLLTNGRRFSDPGFTKKFSAVAEPPFSVAVALHSAKSKIFERITGVKGSFSETVKGLENLFRFFGGEVEIRIVLHSLNLRGLGSLLGFIVKKFGKNKKLRLAVIHYEIEGEAEKNFKKISLKLSASASALSRHKKLLKKTDFYLYHFPLCLVASEFREKCLVTLPRRDRVYPEICSACRERKKCVGLMKTYYERYGAGELRAL